MAEETCMPTIIAMSGSLRAASFNSLLVHAAVALAPPGASIEVASIKGIPLYDADVEAVGMPPEVSALQQRIIAADGLLLVSPEYNNSMPGVLKNALDWLSRPPANMARVFGNLPVGVIGATPGSGGTSLAQAAWLPVLRTLGTLPYFGARVLVSGAAKVFDAEGQLSDPAVRAQLEKYLAGFAVFVSKHGRER
jgi:chromate reductase